MAAESRERQILQTDRQGGRGRGQASTMRPTSGEE